MRPTSCVWLVLLATSAPAATGQDVWPPHWYFDEHRERVDGDSRTIDVVVCALGRGRALHDAEAAAREAARGKVRSLRRSLHADASVPPRRERVTESERRELPGVHEVCVLVRYPVDWVDPERRMRVLERSWDAGAEEAWLGAVRRLAHDYALEGETRCAVKLSRLLALRGTVREDDIGDDAVLEAARTLLGLGETLAAREVLEQRARVSTAPAVVETLAGVLVRLGDPHGAVKVIERLLARLPADDPRAAELTSVAARLRRTDVTGLLDEAGRLLSESKGAEALELARLAVRLAPNDLRCREVLIASIERAQGLEAAIAAGIDAEGVLANSKALAGLTRELRARRADELVRQGQELLAVDEEAACAAFSAAVRVAPADRALEVEEPLFRAVANRLARRLSAEVPPCTVAIEPFGARRQALEVLLRAALVDRGVRVLAPATLAERARGATARDLTRPQADALVAAGTSHLIGLAEGQRCEVFALALADLTVCASETFFVRPPPTTPMTPLITPVAGQLAMELTVSGMRMSQPPVELIIRDGGILRTGDRVRVQLSIDREAHCWVLLIDARGGLTRLFPKTELAFPEDVQEPIRNPVKAGAPFVLPPGGGWFELDDAIGAETIVVVASLNRLDELDRLLDAERTDVTAVRRSLDALEVRGFRSRLVHAATPTSAGSVPPRLTEIIEGSGAVVRTITFDHRPIEDR